MHRSRLPKEPIFPAVYFIKPAERRLWRKDGSSEKRIRLFIGTLTDQQFSLLNQYLTLCIAARGHEERWITLKRYMFIFVFVGIAIGIALGILLARPTTEVYGSGANMHDMHEMSAISASE